MSRKERGEKIRFSIKWNLSPSVRSQLLLLVGIILCFIAGWAAYFRNTRVFLGIIFFYYCALQAALYYGMIHAVYGDDK